MKYEWPTSDDPQQCSFRRWWYGMGQIFGKAWFEQRGPEPSDIWKGALTDVCMSAAADTIRHYMKAGLAFPPNLSEVCEQLRAFNRSYEPSTPRLPKPEIDRAAAEAQIQKMRARGHQRRSVFLPNESFGDYRNSLESSGMSKEQFDAIRLKRNGWTADLERSYCAHAAKVGFGMGHCQDSDAQIAFLEKA